LTITTTRTSPVTRTRTWLGSARSTRSRHPRVLRAWRYATFDGWTVEQRTAIAAYVEALPRLVDLDGEFHTLVERAIRDYWGRLLPDA
jgi:hypothetical protein